MGKSRWTTHPIEALRVRPGFTIADVDHNSCPGWDGDKDDAAEEMDRRGRELYDLQEMLYAGVKSGDETRSALLVLQGMDTSGKDGTIRHVMSGINPQSCRIVSFKQPSIVELDHDFLWRIHRAVPPRGIACGSWSSSSRI